MHGEWTAGDIQKASNEVEILNPELHIATLNKSAKLDIEIRVGKGVGYVPAQRKYCTRSDNWSYSNRFNFHSNQNC